MRGLTSQNGKKRGKRTPGDTGSGYFDLYIRAGAFKGSMGHCSRKSNFLAFTKKTRAESLHLNLLMT